MVWHTLAMPHRTSIHDDPNEAAFRGVQALIQQSEGKNPAAVALGRMGGLKGGPARAAALSEKKRSAIAKKGARARWGRARVKGSVG